MWKFKMISRLEEEQECARFPPMRKRGMFRVDYSQMPRMSQHRWLVTERDSKGIQSLVSPNKEENVQKLPLLKPHYGKTILNVQSVIPVICLTKKMEVARL